MAASPASPASASVRSRSTCRASARSSWNSTTGVIRDRCGTTPLPRSNVSYRLLARMPRLYNGLVGSNPGRAALRTIGLAESPALSGVSLGRALRERGVAVATPAALRSLSVEERARSVVLVQDAFTSYFETPLVLDLIDLIRALGFRPWLAPYRPNGKPLHVHGFLKAFERVASANAAMLRDLADTGVDLIGLDPSMTLTYRSEYAGALNGIPLPRVRLVQEWLGEHLDTITAAGGRHGLPAAAPLHRADDSGLDAPRLADDFRPRRPEAHGPAVRLLRHGGHLRA